MKHFLLTIAIILGAFMGNAQQNPLWLRNTAISPDGKTIAFTFKGDIYTIPTTGGNATRLTSDSYNSYPFWSPDGTRIAFSSNRCGSNDVFVVDANGGTPRRITTYSGNETVLGWLDNSTILFQARIMPSPEDLNGIANSQIYSVEDRENARPELYLSLNTTALSASPAGILLEDRKGYENIWRKHEVSSSTADIWLYRDGKFECMTTFNGNDRNPVWLSNDGSKYAYTSESDNGVLNIFRCVNGGTPEKLTSYDRHPVRSLSASADGSIMAYNYDGEIYTLIPGQSPVKVAVDIVTDNYDSDNLRKFVNAGVSAMVNAPSGDEVAFVLRGEIYTTSVEYSTTRRITNTSGQERSMSFSPDGRSLVYDSERNGRWKLYISKIKNESDDLFTYASEITEELLYESEFTAQQPEFSPDGKKIAFLEDRTILRIIDVDTKEVTTALPGEFNYSYQDGDITFEWSPDSRWLLIDYIGIGGWNNTDIALVAADGSTVVDLTESGYSDSTPHWVLGGKAIAYKSGKYGMRSHGSWGNQTDVLIMGLDDEAWEEFHMSKEEAERAKKAKEKADEAKKKDKKDSDADKDDDAVEPLTFDFANRRHRMERLTDRSGSIGNYYLSADGTKLYFTAYSTEGDFNLYVRDLREDETKVLTHNTRGWFSVDKEGKNLFFLTQNGMSKLDLATGSQKPITFKALYDRQPSAEREYIFDHALQQVKDKFYDINLHGADWDGLGADYRKFLPYINNNTDFTILLSELLGELNASHTGASYYGQKSPSLSTPSLGAYFDPTYKDEGLKVLKLLPRSPLSNKSANVEPGDVILSIDGVEILPGMEYFSLLDGKAGIKVHLEILKPTGAVKDIYVKPMSYYAQTTRIYQEWVERNEVLVDSLSNGRIGYIHIQGMDSESFRTAYDRLLGRYRNCEAVVVDTRFNGGGWLHNDVALLLSGKEYVRYTPRGRYIGSDPFSQWTKPSVMLVNEANYSDAHGTPYTYKTLGIGDVVGAPIPGTMTAVWWEDQIDPTIIFGIPQVTSIDINGNILENQQLEPDVKVINTPNETTSGNDIQLKTAVNHLLQKLDNAAK